MRTICPHIFVRLVTCGLTSKTVSDFKDFESSKVELRAEGIEDMTSIKHWYTIKLTMTAVHEKTSLSVYMSPSRSCCIFTIDKLNNG